MDKKDMAFWFILATIIIATFWWGVWKLTAWSWNAIGGAI